MPLHPLQASLFTRPIELGPGYRFEFTIVNHFPEFRLLDKWTSDVDERRPTLYWEERFTFVARGKKEHVDVAISKAVRLSDQCRFNPDQQQIVAMV